MTTKNLQRRDNGVFYARIQRHGRPLRVSLGTQDLEEAEYRLAVFLENEAVAPPRDIRQDPHAYPHIYFLLDARAGVVKVGRTTDLAKRVKNLQTASVNRLTLLGSIQRTRDMEGLIQRILAPWHRRGEWFAADDAVLGFLRSMLVLDQQAKRQIKRRRRLGTKTDSTLQSAPKTSNASVAA